MHPQAAAMHEYPDPVPQRIYQMRGGAEIKADQVDYGVAAELRDSPAERAIALGSATIERYMLDRLPFGRTVIRPAFSARDRHHLMAFVYQTRHQPGADMPSCSDDYRAQLGVRIGVRKTYGRLACTRDLSTSDADFTKATISSRNPTTQKTVRMT